MEAELKATILQTDAYITQERDSYQLNLKPQGVHFPALGDHTGIIKLSITKGQAADLELQGVPAFPSQIQKH